MVAINTLEETYKRFILPSMHLNLHTMRREVIGPGGNVYALFPVLSGAKDRRPRLWCYNPKANIHLGVAKVPRGLVQDYSRIAVGTDGKIYGCTTKGGRIGLYRYDPKAGKTHSYGFVGPAHTRAGETYAHTMSLIGDYIYLAPERFLGDL